jgi:hypothetical protein
LQQNKGVYTLQMQDGQGHSAPATPLVLTANGQTTAAAIVLPEGIEITATRLGFGAGGDELQLDVTITQSGTFSYLVELKACVGNVVGQPGFGTEAAGWVN